MKEKLFTIFILMMVVLSTVSPAIAATASQKGIDTAAEKITEVQLEKRALSTEKIYIKTFSKEASGDSAVKSQSITLKTTRTEAGIRITSIGSAQKSGVEDSHDILIPIADVPNFNGHSVRVYHYTDAGVMDYQYVQDVVVDSGYIVLPDVEFSSVIVDGATGISSTTYTSYNVTDNSFVASHTADRMVIETVGVDDGVEIDENDSSTYPPEAVGIWTMKNPTDIYNNVTGENNGVSFVNSAGYYNGTVFFQTSHENYNVTDTFTIHTNITPQNIESLYGYVIAKRDGDTKQYAILLNSYTLYGYTWNASGATRVSVSHGFVNNGTYDIRFDFDNGTGRLFINDELVATNPEMNIPVITTSPVFFGSRGDGVGGGAYPFYGYISDGEIYDTVISDYNGTVLYTGYSGTSIKSSTSSTWVPIIDNTATIYNVSGGETYNVLTPTETTASEFTVTYYYTEDTTLETETEDNGVVSFAINFTPSQNYTSTLLNWTPSTNNFTHNLSFTSTDSNASAITHDQIVRITTGTLLADVNYWFNGTLSSLESFNYTCNIISKTPTKVVIEYNSTNSNVENDFYFEDMSASSTFDLKYSNNTIISSVTSDSSGYLQFEDQYLINGTYTVEKQTSTVEKQTSAVSFVAVVFTGLSFVGLYFANRFRRR